MAEELTVSHKLERSLNIIQQSEDKTNKRSALGELRKIFSQTETSGLGDIYTRISKSLHLCFQDRFELCREQSILITTDMLNTLEPDPKYLISLIPALQRRIVCEASQEPSEEIRLLLVKLLHVIIEKYDNLVTPFTNDIIEMLAATIADSAPVVKKESCSCAIALSKVPSQAFYTCSPKLIKPLVDTAGHQHWRVRCIVVETIGSVIQNGDNKCIPDVTTPLAKRLFDDSFHVRMAVTRVVGNWMISLPDRYSFFPVLLPLILTSLTDENDDIVKETEFLWTTAGKQYLNENEKDFKDRIDYISDIMEHYPPNVTRPHLGCRILVEREGGKFLLALGREICDWVASVRIKSAQLLTQVVLHAEASITQQVHKIIGPMCKAATDEEPPVVQNVILAAEYIGYFVPASVHCKLIIETMGEANYGQLRVVSGLVRGSKKDELVEHLTAVGRLLGHSTFEAEEQIAMLNLIESVFFVCGQDSLVIGEDIFLSIISVAGMATAQEILEMALGLLNNFCHLGGNGSSGDGERSGVINRYCGKTLSKLIEPSIWTVHCHQQYIFESLVKHTGEVICQHIEIVLAILRKALSPQSDPEAVLRTLMAVSKIVAHRDITLPKDETFNIFITTMLTDILKEELKWRAGRSAEAIRTAAASCLLACLSYWCKSADHGLNNGELVEVEIVPLVLSLLEDSSPKTKSMAAKSLGCLASIICTMPPIFSDVMTILNKLMSEGLQDIQSQKGGKLHLPFSVVSCVLFLWNMFWRLDAIFRLSDCGLSQYNSDTKLYCDNPQSLRRKMASKRRNMFHKNKTQETKENDILKRLDDCDKVVRLEAIDCIQCLYRELSCCLKNSQVPDDIVDNGLLEFVYTTLLIHLDDQNPDFQLLVLDTLKYISSLNVALLKRKINIANFRDKDICQTLLRFLEER